MNYFNLVDTIKSVSLNYCEEFHEGDVYEFLNSGNHKYPSVILTTQNVTTADGINTIGATLFCVDRLTDDSSNKLEVQSDMFDRLQRIISTLEENTTNLESNTYTPFTEKFADLCAGMFVEFSLQYVGDTLCDNLIEIKEIELTKNGIYDVIGYDKAIVNVKPKLQEITITENGEYTPQEGVDGFSKIISQVVPNEKVKLTGFAVNNACINDEGRWEGEQLIDTSEVTSLNSRFEGLSKLKTLNASNWDVRKVTTIQSFVAGCTNLEEINLSGWETDSLTNMTYPFMGAGIKEFNFGDLNTSNVTTMLETFYQCRKLVKCNVTNWDVRKVTDMRYMFALTKIQSLDLTNWEVNASVKMNEIFWRLPSLISVVGDRTIEDVLENNISAIKNCHFALVLNETNLDRASLRAIINGLADLTGQTTKTLTLGATLRVKLTEEDIAIATNKNWTIA